MKKSITKKDVVELLNGALKADRKAVSNLFLDSNVPCNKRLADHPTIQVVERTVIAGGQRGPMLTVGPLGIINGLFGVFARGPRKGWGGIYMEYDEKTLIIKKFGFVKNWKPVKR